MLFAVKGLIPVGGMVSKLYLSSGPTPGGWNGGGTVIFIWVLSWTTNVALVAPAWDAVNIAEKTMVSVEWKAPRDRQVFSQRLNPEQRPHVSLMGLETRSGKQSRIFHRSPVA